MDKLRLHNSIQTNSHFWFNSTTEAFSPWKLSPITTFTTIGFHNWYFYFFLEKVGHFSSLNLWNLLRPFGKATNSKTFSLVLNFFSCSDCWNEWKIGSLLLVVDQTFELVVLHIIAKFQLFINDDYWFFLAQSLTGSITVLNSNLKKSKQCQQGYDEFTKFQTLVTFKLVADQMSLLYWWKKLFMVGLRLAHLDICASKFWFSWLRRSIWQLQWFNWFN